MKKAICLGFLLFIGSFCFGQSFYLDGNAHIFSYNDLKSLYSLKAQGKVERWSADKLYDFYHSLSNQYRDNSLVLEQKRDEHRNTLIVVYGYVSQVRKSMWGEYIVELEASSSIFNVSVVFPKEISSAMVKELMNIRSGDYFESLAITRGGSAYVDVPVWNQNGVYRTEP